MDSGVITAKVSKPIKQAIVTVAISVDSSGLMWFSGSQGVIVASNIG